MQHPRSLIHPQSCPKLKNDFFIPILLKSHKGKDAPFFKLVNQSSDLRVTEFLQGLEDHILVLKKWTILGDFAGLVEDGLVDIWERNKELIRKRTDIGEHFTRKLSRVSYLFFYH